MKNLKKTMPPQVEVAAPTIAPDFDDDMKDIYWPDFEPLPGESSIRFRLRYTFACAGYSKIKTEEMTTHPIAIVRAVKPETENWRMIDDRRFFKHIRELLRQAGFCPKRDELTVTRTGHRLLVAFQSAKWVPNFEEILREPDGW